jgi:hypothetical protein
LQSVTLEPADLSIGRFLFRCDSAADLARAFGSINAEAIAVLPWVSDKDIEALAVGLQRAKEATHEGIYFQMVHLVKIVGHFENTRASIEYLGALEDITDVVHRLLPAVLTAGRNSI